MAFDERGNFLGKRPEQPTGPADKLEFRIGDVRVVWTRATGTEEEKLELFSKEGNPITGSQRKSYLKPAKAHLEKVQAVQKAEIEKAAAAAAQRQVDSEREQARQLERIVVESKEKAWDEIKDSVHRYFYGIVDGKARYLSGMSEENVKTMVRDCFFRQFNPTYYQKPELKRSPVIVPEERRVQVTNELLARFNQELIGIIRHDNDNFFIVNPDTCINKRMVQRGAWKIFESWVIDQYKLGKFSTYLNNNLVCIDYGSKPEESAAVASGAMLDILARESKLTRVALEEAGWAGKISEEIDEDFFDELITVPEKVS